jgi:hypothetical protein
MEKAARVTGPILSYIRGKLKGKYGDKKPLRIFHTKTIGLVEAAFVVDNDLEGFLKVGLFSKPLSYKAWIRFTNGGPSVGLDTTKMARGMAIKVMDTTSSEYLDSDLLGATQDIVLFTSRAFAPSMGKSQLAGVKLILGSLRDKISGGLTIIRNSFKGSIPFLRSVFIQTPNILEEAYYSGTPYLFGSNKVIKWHVRPLKTISSLMPEKPTENFLRDRLIEDLSGKIDEQVSFALFVQFQNNELTEPIEDCSVVWKTQFYKVATILLSPQNIDTDARYKLDKQMTFSPGHSMKEHAPLGTVNMVRRIVYERLAKERLAHPE